MEYDASKLHSWREIVQLAESGDADHRRLSVIFAQMHGEAYLRTIVGRQADERGFGWALRHAAKRGLIDRYLVERASAPRWARNTLVHSDSKMDVSSHQALSVVSVLHDLCSEKLNAPLPAARTSAAALAVSEKAGPSALSVLAVLALVGGVAASAVLIASADSSKTAQRPVSSSSIGEFARLTASGALDGLKWPLMFVAMGALILFWLPAADKSVGAGVPMRGDTSHAGAVLQEKTRDREPDVDHARPPAYGRCVADGRCVRDPEFEAFFYDLVLWDNAQPPSQMSADERRALGAVVAEDEGGSFPFYFAWLAGFPRGCELTPNAIEIENATDTFMVLFLDNVRLSVLGNRTKLPFVPRGSVLHVCLEKTGVHLVSGYSFPVKDGTISVDRAIKFSEERTFLAHVGSNGHSRVVVDEAYVRRNRLR